ncbi:MAG: hypothetical protein ABIJ00_06765 [Candidatus Eisenbacteria bacterium]
MKLVTAGLVALFLLWSGAALGTTFYTPTLDGYNDFPAESFFDVVFIDGCPYGLAITWDADFLWLSVDSDTCRRFLGDGAGPPADLSFFVAIDVDQTFGSGAPADGYGNVNFYGCYMPEYIFYFAGGGGWYEWGYWTGTEWDWRGWRNDNTYYAWPGGDVWDDEFGVLWSDLGLPQGVAVMAWITDDVTFGTDPGVLASWPIQNPIGVLPTFMWAYPFFFPHVPGPMPVAGFAPNSVSATSGEFTATAASSWGGIKALYR